MAVEFEGFVEALSYKGKGDISLPCLAVNLAILGVETVEVNHASLVGRGISNEEGISSIPDGEGISLGTDGVRVDVAPVTWHFDLASIITQAEVAFSEGQPIMPAIKLHEDDPNNSAMHYILLLGHDKNPTTGEVERIYVGDSRYDDIQTRTPDEVLGSLNLTLRWIGALFSYPVEVTRYDS